jgi:hypothetical protein
MSKAMTCLAVLSLVGCSSNEPRAVAKRFWTAYQFGDQKDLASLTTQASQDAVRYLGTDKDVEKSEVVLGEATLEETGDRAVVPTTLKNPDRPDLAMQTILLREDGKWKVAIHETHASAIGGAFRGLGAAFMQAMGETAKSLGRTAEEAGGQVKEAGEKMAGQQQQ